MNGRVYDPNLGRFLSVDPVFEFPTNMQSLNPYSYVLNNPLSLTDPTGYTACSDVSTTKGHDAGMCSVTDKDGNKSWIGYNVRSNGNVEINTADFKAAMPVLQNMAPNGATKSQGTNSVQTKSANPADINNPAQIAKQGQVADLTGLNICLLCEKKPSYQDPHHLQTSDAQILATEKNEAVFPAAFPYSDNNADSVGYGYHLDSLAKIRLYKSVRNKDGSLSASAADSLTRNFESTYVHTTINREIKTHMTQGQYDAASDYIYQHGHLPAGFIHAFNRHDYLRAGLELYDPGYPGRTGRDVTEYLNATPETSVWPEE